jgi:hypothetical protein
MGAGHERSSRRVSCGHGCARVSRVVVVAPLKKGRREEARLLLEQGPPYDLAETALTGHQVYLTDAEAVFIFEGREAMHWVERLVGEPGLVRVAAAWMDCLDSRPRLAVESFSWVDTADG